MLVVPGLALMARPGAGNGQGILEAVMEAGRPLAALEPACEPSVLARIFPGEARYPGLAALSYLADFGVRCTGGCLRLDPVGLGVGTAGLFLRQRWFPDLGMAQLQELTLAAADALAPSGLRLELAPSGRLYLLSATSLGRGLQSPWEGEGENLLEVWTDGSMDKALMALMNEVQVVLHQHGVNLDRRDRGLGPVNCLWPWGGGPAVDLQSLDRVEIWSNGEAMAAGLSEMGGLPCRQAEGLAEVRPETGRSLLCWLSGETSLEVRKAELEQHWLAPLLGKWIPPSRLVLCGLDGEGVELGPRHWWSMKLKSQVRRART